MKFQSPTAYKMQDQGGLAKSTITHPGFRPVQDLTTKKGAMTLSPQAANTMQYTSTTTGRGQKQEDSGRVAKGTTPWRQVYFSWLPRESLFPFLKEGVRTMVSLKGV